MKMPVFAPCGRALLVQRIGRGLRVEEVAQTAGVSVRTACKWLRRYERKVRLVCWIARPDRTIAPHATSADSAGTYRRAAA